MTVILPPWPAMRRLPELQARRAWAFDYEIALRQANPGLVLGAGMAVFLAAFTFAAAVNDER